VLRGGSVDLVVGTRDDRTSASWRGLVTCGSPWACPVCTAHISDDRTTNIGLVLDTVRAQGCLVVMVTFTVRHSNRDSLRKVWSGVSKGWTACTSGGEWQAVRDALGVDFVRAVEVTHSDNGWHVHVHAALVLPATVAALGDQAAGSLIFDIVDGMWRRWDRAATRAGLRPGLRGVGSDWRVVGPKEDIGDYLGKWGTNVEGWGVAEELGLWDAKKGRRGSRSPWQILAGLVDGTSVDEEQDLALWQEWEGGSKGKRRIHASRGFWTLAHVQERKDAEIAADVLVCEDDTVVMTLELRDWKLVTAARCDWVMMEWAVMGRVDWCWGLLEALRRKQFETQTKIRKGSFKRRRR
jgi:hypothetical protein